MPPRNRRRLLRNTRLARFCTWPPSTGGGGIENPVTAIGPQNRVSAKGVRGRGINGIVINRPVAFRRKRYPDEDAFAPDIRHKNMSDLSS